MMVSFCSWDWRRRGVPVPARFCHFSQWGHGAKASSRLTPQPQLSNSLLELLLHCKRRDIHQCHSGSLVPAAELWAVQYPLQNSRQLTMKLLRFPFCLLPSRQGIIFIPRLSTWISPFVHDQWDCACFRKLSGFIPGRCACWAVVLQKRKEIYRSFHVPRLKYRAVKGGSCFLAWYLPLLVWIFKHIPSRTC